MVFKKPFSYIFVRIDRGGDIVPTDEQLIKEINNGSQAAMEVLVKRHYRLVFSYVYRKIGDYHPMI